MRIPGRSNCPLPGILPSKGHKALHLQRVWRVEVDMMAAGGLHQSLGVSAPLVKSSAVLRLLLFLKGRLQSNLTLNGCEWMRSYLNQRENFKFSWLPYLVLMKS